MLFLEVDYALAYFFKGRRSKMITKHYFRVGFLMITRRMFWVLAWSLRLHKLPHHCAVEILPLCFPPMHLSLLPGIRNIHFFFFFNLISHLPNFYFAKFVFFILLSSQYRQESRLNVMKCR